MRGHRFWHLSGAVARASGDSEKLTKGESARQPVLQLLEAETLVSGQSWTAQGCQAGLRARPEGGPALGQLLPWHFPRNRPTGQVENSLTSEKMSQREAQGGPQGQGCPFRVPLKLRLTACFQGPLTLQANSLDFLVSPDSA